MDDLNEILDAAYARGQLSGIDGKKPMINDLKTFADAYTTNKIIEELTDLVRYTSGKSVYEAHAIVLKNIDKRIKVLNHRKGLE
jgi:hypothetical protein